MKRRPQHPLVVSYIYFNVCLTWILCFSVLSRSFKKKKHPVQVQNSKSTIINIVVIFILVIDFNLARQLDRSNFNSEILLIHFAKFC